MILYEYPFNESIRTMLRLEQLFDRLGQLLPRDAAVDHHFALVTLFEIMDVDRVALLVLQVGVRQLQIFEDVGSGHPRRPSLNPCQ